ncbi:MAG TPA: Arm DNA-binding domain-containing protein, partial [Acetobacteraceae bacterium]|nr:Arm DNA-binding domain-containing protein [Acetobacteraceae bacterium]
MVTIPENGIRTRPPIRERLANRLTAAIACGLREPGKYADGNGLWLMVEGPHRRRWYFRFMRDGKERAMALGDANLITLAEARELHTEARKLLAHGIDPLDQRHQQKAADNSVRPTITTFADAAAAYLTMHEAGWRNPKHRQQWRNTLAETYPAIGAIPVRDIDTDHVLQVL